MRTGASSMVPTVTSRPRSAARRSTLRIKVSRWRTAVVANMARPLGGEGGPRTSRRPALKAIGRQRRQRRPCIAAGGLGMSWPKRHRCPAQLPGGKPVTSAVGRSPRAAPARKERPQKAAAERPAGYAVAPSPRPPAGSFRRSVAGRAPLAAARAFLCGPAIAATAHKKDGGTVRQQKRPLGSLANRGLLP